MNYESPYVHGTEILHKISGYQGRIVRHFSPLLLKNEKCGSVDDVEILDRVSCYLIKTKYRCKFKSRFAIGNDGSFILNFSIS